mgnify:CR=1 FL=1
MSDKSSKSNESLKAKFENFAGIEKLEGFSLSRLFSDVFKHHPAAEVEGMFTIGTERTTPKIENVDCSWPRPWMFFRALAGSVFVYVLFVVGWECFANVNLLPGLIAVGAFAMPIATLVFFFEVNVRRNVSVYQVMRLVVKGGVISILFSLVLYVLPLEELSGLGASVAGMIEEPGKLFALLVMAKSDRYHYKLNGLLLGAAVGTGFAAFESMGYAFSILLDEGPGAMSGNILLRGFFSPFGHVVWTAICGFALWRVKGKKAFTWNMVEDVKFWHLALVPVVLHAIWNADFELPFLAKYFTLGIVAWSVVLALVQEGLKELREEQRIVMSLPDPNE